MSVGILDSTFRWLAAACNGGIGKIAALPSFEKVFYFRRELLVGKSVEAATSPIPTTLHEMAEARLGFEKCHHEG
jgi:hypothetical protein